MTPRESPVVEASPVRPPPDAVPLDDAVWAFNAKKLHKDYKAGIAYRENLRLHAEPSGETIRMRNARLRRPGSVSAETALPRPVIPDPAAVLSDARNRLVAKLQKGQLRSWGRDETGAWR